MKFTITEPIIDPNSPVFPCIVQHHTSIKQPGFWGFIAYLMPPDADPDCRVKLIQLNTGSETFTSLDNIGEDNTYYPLPPGTILTIEQG